MEHEYHIPVLAREAIEALNMKPGSIYIDATLGGTFPESPAVHSEASRDGVPREQAPRERVRTLGADELGEGAEVER